MEGGTLRDQYPQIFAITRQKGVNMCNFYMKVGEGGGVASFGFEEPEWLGSRRLWEDVKHPFFTDIG